MTIDRIIGTSETLVGPDKFWTILTKLQVFSSNPDTKQIQNSLRVALWNMYLAPTFNPSNKADGKQAVLKAIIQEVIKVLLSPYLENEAKAELL